MEFSLLHYKKKILKYEKLKMSSCIYNLLVALNPDFLFMILVEFMPPPKQQ